MCSLALLLHLTVEMPLNAVVRGFGYAVVPVTRRNRRDGASKLRLNQMGSRYLFIVLNVWLEHHLSHGDYRRRDVPQTTATRRSSIRSRAA